MVPTQESGPQEMVVAAISETLRPEVVWKADRLESLEMLFHHGDLCRIHPSNADGKAVAVEVADADLVGVPARPQQPDPPVLQIEPRRIFMQVDGDRLAGDRELVFHSCKADRLLADVEVPAEAADHLDVRDRGLLDSQVQMLSGAGGLVQG